MPGSRRATSQGRARSRRRRSSASIAPALGGNWCRKQRSFWRSSIGRCRTWCRPSSAGGSTSRPSSPSTRRSRRCGASSTDGSACARATAHPTPSPRTSDGDSTPSAQTCIASRLVSTRTPVHRSVGIVHTHVVLPRTTYSRTVRQSVNVLNVHVHVHPRQGLQ